MVNPFNPDRDEIRRRKELENQVKGELDELSRVSREMLEDLRYKRIKELAQKAQEDLISLIMSYDEPDLVKYKNDINRYKAQLEVYNKMLNAVDNYSKPTHKPNVNFMTRFFTEWKKDLERIN